MAKATLELTADNTSIRRALGEIPELSKRAADAIKRDFGQISTQGIAEFSKLTREAARNLASMRRAEEATSQARGRRNQTDTALAISEDSRRTRSAESEAGKRSRIPYREAEETQKAKRNELSVIERVEKEKTRIIEREAQARARTIARAQHAIETGAVWRSPGAGAGADAMGGPSGAPGGSMSYRSRWMDLTFNMGRAARDTMTNIHSQVQGARERDADIQRTIGLALYQAGGDRQDVVAARRRIGQFAATNGIDAQELAGAMNAAQTEFSIFGDRNTTAADRNARIGDFLQTALLARNTGNDIGETARLTGLFANAGLDPDAQRRMVLFAAGASQRGAVEMGMLTRSAMPAITGRMSAAMGALGAGATSQERSAAAQNAFVQAYSELQIARGAQGVSPTMAGNALRNMNSSLQGDVVQQRMLANIRNDSSLSRASRTQLEQALFEADPSRRGHLRLRTTDALGVISAAGGVLGANSTGFNNLFAGGGHNNPQSLQANWRRIAGGFLSSDAEGQTGLQRIKSLMDVNATSLNQSDIDRGARVFGGDPRAELNRNMEAQQNSLRDNTSALVRLSDQLANWQSRNPMTSALLGGAAAGLGGTLLQRFGTFQIMQTAAGGAAGAAGPGAAAAAAGGAARLGPGGMLAVGASGAAGLALGDQLYGFLDRRRNGGHTGLAGNRSDSVFNASSWNVFSGAGDVLMDSLGLGHHTETASKFQSREKREMTPEQYAQALAQALQNTRLNVVMDTHQLAMAAAQQASGANSPPPERRR